MTHAPFCLLTVWRDGERPRVRRLPRLQRPDDGGGRLQRQERMARLGRTEGGGAKAAAVAVVAVAAAAASCNK